MAESIQLRVLPKSLREFEKSNGASKLEYLKYLRANTAHHHYGQYKTLERWYETECKTR